MSIIFSIIGTKLAWIGAMNLVWNRATKLAWNRASFLAPRAAYWRFCQYAALGAKSLEMSESLIIPN